MNHFSSPNFCYYYRQLSEGIRELADKNFALLREDPHHPSLRLRKIGTYWSARVGLHYRALARDRAEGLVWFWIGHHSEYDKLLA
jgi:hypothetical protein